MGMLASWLAIVNILGTIATGCYDQAIVLPEEDKQAVDIVFLGCCIAVIVGIGITIACIFLKDYLVSWLKLDGISPFWFYCLGFTVILLGIEHVFTRFSIRNKHFKILASTQVIQQTGTNGIKIYAGFQHIGAGGLFISTIFGQIIRSVCLIWNEKKRFLNKNWTLEFSRIKEAASRYKKFPIFSIWGQFFNVASVQIPIVIFSILFSTEVVGYYSLGHRILSLPMALIGQSVGNVFLERAAKARENEEELKRITLDIYKKLLFIGTLGLSFITFYGSWIFSFVFGAAWKEAGVYAQFISIWIVFQLSVSPISSIFYVLERQGESLFWQVIQFLSRFSVVLLFFFIGENIITIVAMYAIISAVYYLFLALRVLILVKTKIISIFQSIIKYSVSIYGVQFGIYLIVRNFIPMQP
jgi:O-antigen/teichoic acid export membrane protein